MILTYNRIGNNIHDVQQFLIYQNLINTQKFITLYTLVRIFPTDILSTN